MHRSTKNVWPFPTWALLAIAIPAVAVAGVQPQGVQPQGVQPQGVQPQGVQPQGVQPQGVQPQGVQPQGVQPQGVQPQGVQPQGVQPQGVQPQGVQPQGVALMGNDLVSIEGKGVLIKSVDLRGTSSTSDPVSHVLTSIPGVSTGGGNYISVGGGSAVGHYAIAHLADATGTLVAPAEDLDLYIAEEKKDPVSNLFHRFEEQDNQDELYVIYFFHKWSGQWVSLCPYDAHTKMASAMAIPEAGPPNTFSLACTATGVNSKCARGWGYRPWAQTSAWVFSGGAWSLQTFPLKEYYDICTNAAMAGYCQDGRSYTKNGTLVDLYDTRQIIWPNAIENPFSESNPDSQWMMAQEYFISTGVDANNPLLRASALQRTRYKELSPSAECADFAFIDRLEHDHIEDGRWANPLTTTPRLQVFSPTSCTHNEYVVGDALPWDCTPCTTQVCKTKPECCGAGPTPGWSAACRNEALSVCKTGADQWPKGRVWPAQIDTSGPTILAKYLFGPQGAVMRVEGTSGMGSSATVSGWACDPEWPNATVAVAIYDAPRETVEAPLAVVQADKAIAAPLAREVSAACDGPGRSYARHGFSFTLPENQSANVFVYAIDQATADGPAAPPTLIRNGIIHVPRCAHSEHVAGAALASDCSACATSVCTSSPSCCSSSWTDSCANLANACAASDSSAPGNSRVFAAVTTGWIEAPSDGTYTFDSSLQPSRLFINGTSVLDWFETSPGTTQGSITLRAGQKYHLRWDRLQSAPPPGSGPGLTWQPPGASGQIEIPSGQLYALAPGSGSGLKASYFDDPGLTGTRKDRFVPSPDPYVDINNNVQPPSPLPPPDLPALFTLPYSAIWEGEVVPSFSEDYTFYVEGPGVSTLTINGVPVPLISPTANSAPGGCAHDLCEFGDRLDASCNTCVQKVCAKDDYCCNGGYLSYYSFGPEWDSKCIAEVNQYCGAGLCSTPPAGAGMTTKKLGPLTLKAGVHYAIGLTYDSTATDKTIRLLWSSARTARQVVPKFALFPKDAPAAGLGAGLNVTYFGTTTVNNVVKPDLFNVVAVGFATDLSLTPTIGQTGTPLVDVLASLSDTAAATPPPPMVVRPRYEDQVSSATPQVTVDGIGGLPGGSVRIGLASDPSVEVIATVQNNGTFSAIVGVGTFTATPKVLKLLQRAPGATCVVPTPGECSYELTWPVTVTEATAATKPPVIFSPSDPTHSPNPLANTFTVTGEGTSGAVHIVDQGSFPDTFTDITPAADGSFTGSITLTAGDPVTPLKGWHKLVFNQGGTPSPPVFVSVGIDPPTVEFPRNGAELDCKEPDQAFPPPARGSIPYPEDKFGPLRVFEETGRDALGDIGAQTRIIPPTQLGDPIRFESFYNPGPGRHVLLFFQAPDPPQGATQKERDAHFRAFSSLADTPFSRIVINVPPPRFPIPPGIAGVLGGRGITGGIANFPTGGQGPLPINVLDCPGSLLCAEPNADVNVRVGSRLHTTRASATGAWSLSVPLSPGWNALTFAQVSDSRVGGAWSESCLSNEIDIGVRQTGGPVINVPADITDVEATSPRGAKVFYPEVTAYRATDGLQLPVTCDPPSGSTFGVGRNAVLCTATDPATGAIGLGEFAITVVDGPPVVNVPPGGITAEAQSAVGAMVDFSNDVSASDAFDGPLPIECAPSSPALFLLDQPTPVLCEATDHLNHTTKETFFVRVVDTTPPDLCFLPNLKVGSGASGGAFVDFKPCAKDVVDGPLTASCDHAPGSFFPVGQTVVTCSAVDGHRNQSPPVTFTVDVGDSTPPVLKLPTVVSAIATSRSGARVSYTVTATDNVDPKPTVKCNPPSGALFPLGRTPVNCTATDAAGNQSTGSFIVKVTVGWTDFLPPVNQDGSARFLLGVPIGLRFALAGASANIWDLNAKLFVAPLNAAGTPGTERPAAGLPPGAGNVFYFIPIINQYAMLLDTRPLGVGPWQLRVDLGDGEVHTQRITFFKL